MRITIRWVAAAMVAIGMSLATGWSPSEPGVKNQAGSFKTTAAAAAALEDLDLVITKNVSTTLDGQVKARSAQDPLFKVNIEKIGDNVCDVWVRVGTFGDAGQSQTIIKNIKERLPQ